VDDALLLEKLNEGHEPIALDAVLVQTVRGPVRRGHQDAAAGPQFFEQLPQMTGYQS